MSQQRKPTRKNIEKGRLQKLLFEESAIVITLTNGCKKWLLEKFNNQKKEIVVIPHGYIISPDESNIYRSLLKDKRKENFVYLVGDMRQNKEINLSIRGFLDCAKLSECVLTVIMKPPEFTNERVRDFLVTIKSSPRIKVISSPEITNEVIYRAFFRSHVCILPYLWGTHSGQVELSKDCGCYPVISDTGFFREQSNEIIEFKYNDDINIFATNFLKAAIKAYNLPLIKPETVFRKREFEIIKNEHIETYKKSFSMI